MVPWVQLDAIAVPGGGNLRLMRRGTEFSIMLGSNELMNSRVSGSESALARLASVLSFLTPARRPLPLGVATQSLLAAFPALISPAATYWVDPKANCP